MIVLWRVTDKCNLACGFCAYDRRLSLARSSVEAGPVARFGRLLGQYRQHTGRPVLVSWIGGEPLLWRPWHDCSQLLQERDGLAVSATTNGTTLHRQAVRGQVIASLTELTVSVDGFAEFHNHIRGWPDGWQQLKMALQSLDRERRDAGAALKLRANLVVMRDNLATFGAVCQELADWGFDEITFNQLGGRDRPEFFADHRLDPVAAQTLVQLVPPLQTLLARRGVRLCASAPYLARIVASAGEVRLPVADCAAGQRFLFIDERNRVAPCSFTVDDYGVALDQIRTVDDLLDLPARFAAARARTAQPVCDDCPSTQVFAKFES